MIAKSKNMTAGAKPCQVEAVTACIKCFVDQRRCSCVLYLETYTLSGNASTPFRPSVRSIIFQQQKHHRPAR